MRSTRATLTAPISMALCIGLATALGIGLATTARAQEEPAPVGRGPPAVPVPHRATGRLGKHPRESFGAGRWVQNRG